MKWGLNIAIVVFFQATVFHVFAAESLIGTWRLDRQEINDQRTNSSPLTLKISQVGDQLAFAFSVPLNNADQVSMTYAVKLDGSEADVKNARGEKVGTIRMTSSGPSQYKLTLTGPNRPDSSGRLTVSPDGNTLTSEADTVQSGRSMHSRQWFSRY